MELNTRDRYCVRALTTPFGSRWARTNCNEVFIPAIGQYFINVDINAESVKVPISFSSLESTVRRQLNSPNNDISSIILDLNIPANSYYEGTFDTAIKRVSEAHSLIKVVGKGVTFYGNPGVIFSGDGTPLFYCGMVINRDFIIKSFYIKFNPIIFSDQDNVLNRFIVRKLIPYCYERTFDTVYEWANLENDKFDIQFTSDFSELQTPIAPTKELTTEEVKDCLLLNMGTIAYQANQNE